MFLWLSKCFVMIVMSFDALTAVAPFNFVV